MTKDPAVMYLIVNSALGMSPGKIAAQVGHAVEELLLEMVDYKEGLQWTEDEDYAREARRAVGHWDAYKKDGTTKIILKAEKEWEELRKLADIVVIDEGRTEIPPNSETVLGFFPVRKSNVPELLKQLKLL